MEGFLAMQRVTFSLFLILSPWILGCGGGPSDLPPLGTVTGVVKLDGEPLPGALVTFSPAKGRSSSAETDATGRYELRYSVEHKGAVVGQHSVSISTRRDAVSAEGSGQSQPAVAEKVPKRYNDDTQLSEEVKAGANTIDFDLQSKGA